MKYCKISHLLHTQGTPENNTDLSHYDKDVAQKSGKMRTEHSGGGEMTTHRSSTFGVEQEVHPKQDKRSATK